ncbi:hypothetical protein [Microbacterium sp. NPDC091662]|uniref:hypothetical protein n=1 Tax=Microbacterium sp. NPDC091662 TaxID=3364211 RepID=UPI0037F943DC
MLHPQAELEGWIRDCVDHLRAADNYRVARAHQDEFYLLFGVIVRTIRYADAYLDLVHLNKEAEAVPLARAALEHAITLQWVFIVDGGVARFSRSVASERASHYAKLADWLENEELLLEVGKLEEPPAGKGLAPFTNLMRELDHDEFLETTIRQSRRWRHRNVGARHDHAGECWRIQRG